jgi:thiol:disulfide interchange protein DsbA
MARLLAALAVLALFAVPATAKEYERGFHYIVLQKPQRSSVPADKVEVMEVFSYGCSACNGFQPMWKKLKASLPANAQAVYLPAAFLPHENWVVFQRAYLTAVSMGVADKAHDAMYEAIWKTGELGIIDPATNQLKRQMPTIEDVGRFYARVAGVKAETFVGTAKSFIIEGKMHDADARIIEMQVPGTPAIIVAGKYRVNMQALKDEADLIALVKFLVEKESAPAPAAAAN